MRKREAVLAAFLLYFGLGSSVVAEDRTYGDVYLSGLARTSWAYNPPGIQSAMVCNVNGPDGFLTVRSGPDTSFAKVRAFNRLAILDVNTARRSGRWVRVVHGYRTVTKDGFSQQPKDLPVEGWAHDGYLCDFIH